MQLLRSRLMDPAQCFERGGENGGVKGGKLGIEKNDKSGGGIAIPLSAFSNQSKRKWGGDDEEGGSCQFVCDWKMRRLLSVCCG